MLCYDMLSIASVHCLPDTVVAMILLFGATLDCTPSCYSNLFVEFFVRAHMTLEEIACLVFHFICGIPFGDLF